MLFTMSDTSDMSEETTRGRHTMRGPLRRDRRSKVIAGVCGGLGRHLDIDPVVFRILFAVLSFVGGVGLLAYAAAWLFVPQEGAERSEGHRMLAGSNPLLAVLVTIGLALGALGAISALTEGGSSNWPLWMIAAAVVGVLIWRGDIKLGRGERHTVPAPPPTWWQQPVAETPNGSQGTTTDGGEPSSTAEFVGQAGTEQVTGPHEYVTGQRDATPPTFTLGAQQYGPQYAQRYGPRSGTAYYAPKPEPERVRRRGYGGLVLASLLAVTGALGVLDAAGLINLSWLAGGAIVLVLLGAGMVIGGLFGKTTALVPVGLVVAVPLITLTAVGVPLHGAVGDADWTPSSAATVRSSYQLAVGDGNLDLTNVEPGAGKTITVSAQVGIGDLTARLPSNVNVVIHAHTGIGLVDDGVSQDSDGYGTSRDNGIRVSKNLNIPAQGKAQGTIVLDLKTGIGDVDVDAEAGS